MKKRKKNNPTLHERTHNNMTHKKTEQATEVQSLDTDIAQAQRAGESQHTDMLSLETITGLVEKCVAERLQSSCTDCKCQQHVEIVENQQETQEDMEVETVDIPDDVAAMIASTWSGCIKEMKSRDLLEKSFKVPQFFKAEIFADGSLILRAIDLPTGIVMVGREKMDSSTFNKNIVFAQQGTSVNSEPPQRGGGAMKTLYIEGDEVHIG